MKLFSGNEFSCEINDKVFEKILSFYPEEKLSSYSSFEKAIRNKKISIKELKDSSKKIQIPWQMFFLNEAKITKELKQRDELINAKFEDKKISKRAGSGKVTSKRIIERVVNLQEYTSAQLQNKCNFIGSLKGKDVRVSAKQIIDYFEINLETFRGKKTAEESCDYLINQIHTKSSICVSRGVLKNDILPIVKNIKDVLGNTSGFVIKDEKAPFIFLPSEASDSENAYRQNLTLIYLLTVLGLEYWEYSFNDNYSFKKNDADDKYKLIYDIVSEFLLPSSLSDSLRGTNIDKGVINKLKDDHKLSFSAVLIILLRRSVIDKVLYNALELPKSSFKKNSLGLFFNTPKVKTSAEKFCSETAFKIIERNIKSNSLFPIKAQYLIFGNVNHKKFKELFK